MKKAAIYSGAAGLLDEVALAGAVVRRVRECEALHDAVTPFRIGAAANIDAAMQQYVAVVRSFEPPGPARMMALRWALSAYVGEESKSYGRSQRSSHLAGSVTSFGIGNLKCNKLVADAYAVGAGAGLSIGADWFSEGEGSGWPAQRQAGSVWPPQANHLADVTKNLRSLTNARPLRQPGEDKANPELGDIIAFPAEAASGHVGLYLGRNLIVSAKETGIEIGTVAAEQGAHGGSARIRKFNGSGR